MTKKPKNKKKNMIPINKSLLQKPIKNEKMVIEAIFDEGYEAGWDDCFDNSLDNLHTSGWISCLEAIASGEIEAPEVSEKSVKEIQKMRISLEDNDK